MALLLPETPIDRDNRGLVENVGGKPDSDPCNGVAVENPGVLLVIVDCDAVKHIDLVITALPESVGTAEDEVDNDIKVDKEAIPDSWGEAERLICTDGLTDANILPVTDAPLVADVDKKCEADTELVNIGTIVIAEVVVSEP